MRVLLTGATGYIGSHTAGALVKAGHDVVALVRDEGRLAAALAPHGITVDHAPGDMTDPHAVAAEADVTHTTAYTYFSSKAHLVAEVFWRLLQRIPAPVHDPAASWPERVEAALGEPGTAVSGKPELAQAALSALLSSDPDVQRLRDQIGADLAERLRTTLGEGVDPRASETILLTFSGAMLQAGMGYFDFTGVVERVRTAAELFDR